MRAAKNKPNADWRENYVKQVSLGDWSALKENAMPKVVQGVFGGEENHAGRIW
ncbi:hypothetical protein CJA_0365 [Cellvibrio japonicus Ueda107]|uniref:Uncharacterized protein n=1 Tax=Cellvibrio japonicus (strain Ueda107) TaxID=498211 RepID=B3PI25_CELJU|nr:hypothetical protein CJA_0365 [Cellvibrio japonicus Ueda107]